MCKNCSTFAGEMSNKSDHSGLFASGSARKAMYRRWVYMAVAIVAAALLPMKPVFSFQTDKGIIYERSFSMDDRTFYVVQTELDTGKAHLVATMPVKGLRYCYLAMLWGSILCLLCFYPEWRVWGCVFTAVAAGMYYVLMAYYAVVIAEDYYATLYPNYMAILPAVVLQMMVLTRRNVIKQINDEVEPE